MQRRHQKVIEEAPAPGMTPERRRAMGEAAVAAAKAVAYVGAGTVEFIVEPSGKFFFMEMNTRLQVEHPVTEMITGQDLVEWQLRVAAGEPLPCTQDQLTIDGHAIEARIYAENPDKGFLPSTGTLAHLVTPDAVEFALGLAASPLSGASTGVEPAAVRIDSGVRQGDTISPFYDPMIAKLIVWGRDRAQAIERLHQALGQMRVVGPQTNVAFLGRLMRCTSFASADLDTALIERERAALFPLAGEPSLARLARACAAVLANEAKHYADQTAQTGSPGDPWNQMNGWRVNGAMQRTITFGIAERQMALSLEYAPRGFTVRPLDAAGSDAANADEPAICLAQLQLTGAALRGLAGDQAFSASAVFNNETLHLFDAEGHLALHYAPPLAHAGDDSAELGRLTAPMPGKVIALLAKAGDKVSKGQALVVMEAMKMEHTIAAPADGQITALTYAVGDQVVEGVELIGFKPT